MWGSMVHHWKQRGRALPIREASAFPRRLSNSDRYRSKEPTEKPAAISDRADYFRELLMSVNLVFSVEPRPFTATIVAIEMPAAIRPYSMAFTRPNENPPA